MKERYSFLCSLILLTAAILPLKDDPPPQFSAVRIDGYQHLDIGFRSQHWDWSLGGPRDWCNKLIDPDLGADGGGWIVKSEEIATEYHLLLRIVNQPFLKTTPVASEERFVPNLRSADMQLAYALKMWSWALVAQNDSAIKSVCDKRFRIAAHALRRVLRRFPENHLICSYAQLALGLCDGDGPSYRSVTELLKVRRSYAEYPYRCQLSELYIAETLAREGATQRARRVARTAVSRYRPYQPSSAGDRILFTFRLTSPITP